jgi:putative effector of murein hydrolase
MTPQINELWVYLSTSPLLGLTLTLLAYQGAWWIHRRAGFSPLANPVMIAVAALVALLAVTDTPYQTYFDGAQFVHFLLGPATVALAVPLVHTVSARARDARTGYRRPAGRQRCRGGVRGSGGAAVRRQPGATQLSLAPKSVTTPIAMGIAERIGGIPSLTAVLVISTGILGAVLGRYLFDALRIDDAGDPGLCHRQSPRTASARRVPFRRASRQAPSRRWRWA